MKKIFLISILVVICAFSFNNKAKAQLIDEKNVTITMDLQPILQLTMETPDQLTFIFDELDKYYAGITKYGATVLKVSSTVSWDLYAIGESNGMNGVGLWDQQMIYGTAAANAENDIPLSALEIRQSHANPAVGALDYSQAFANVSTSIGVTGATAATGTTGPTGGSGNYSNSVYYDYAGLERAPLHGQRYIAGDKGTTVGLQVDGGSYLTQTGTTSDYYYVLDYRILPSLPVTFPMAMNPVDYSSEAIATYAQPGVYTMYVKYVLLEDQ